MTINRLIRELELIRDNQGNVRVCVNSDAFHEIAVNWPDGTLLKVGGVEFVCVEMADGDGFTAQDSRGRAKMARLAVIKP